MRVQRVANIAQGLAQTSGHYLAETFVTTLALGQPLTFHTHILVGASPGPTVGIVSGLHGDEISTAELVLLLLDHLNTKTLRGSLLLAPMVNALTFETGTRSTTLDAANLNRVFPGSPTGTITQMLAHAFCQHFLNACDYLLDTHAEPDSMAIRCAYAFAPDDAYGQRSLDLAQASGSPIIYIFRSLAGSLADVARTKDVPTLLLETGGPLPGPDGRMAEAKRELLNVLCYLEMIPGVVEPPAAQVVVTEATHLRAPVGGLFRPEIGFDAVGKPLEGGIHLGSVVSPYTGELLAKIVSPQAPSWLLMARGRTSRVHPGDPLYMVGSTPAH